MSKVVALMSMSLDGYVADVNDGVAKSANVVEQPPIVPTRWRLL